MKKPIIYGLIGGLAVALYFMFGQQDKEPVKELAEAPKKPVKKPAVIKGKPVSSGGGKGSGFYNDNPIEREIRVGENVIGVVKPNPRAELAIM